MSTDCREDFSNIGAEHVDSGVFKVTIGGGMVEIVE
jgi:hypothetical protein